MNPLDSYLARVAHQLRFVPPSKREDELRELRSHLEQCVEDLQQEGLSLEAAQLRGTKSFGNPSALGARLTDAWEGIPFSWWRVGATCAGITILWTFSVLFLSTWMMILGTFSSLSVLPELPTLTYGLFLSLPICCGLLFTHWLGRRGRLIGTFYTALLFLGLNTHVRFAPSSSFVKTDLSHLFLALLNSPWALLLNVVLAFVGAHLGYASRVRTRVRLATANGLTFSPRPVRIFRIPFNPKTWRRALYLFGLFGLLLGIRVWLTCHPLTPAAALRYSLITGNISDNFEAPRFSLLQELPPSTPAELAGKERRVRFELQASAKPDFASSQLAYLRREAAAEARSKYGVDPRTRAAIVRVRANNTMVKGVARMVKTPKGWQPDDKSFDRSELWAWFYVH